MRGAQIARQIRKRARRIGFGKRIAPLAPIGGGAERDRDGLRQFFERMKLRTERRQHDPISLFALQARQHSGAQQRGFSRAGGAEHGNQFCAALRAPRVQPLDQAANVVVAAEIDRRVGFIERQQPGIRRALAIPLETAARVEHNFGEAGGQPRQAAFAILQQIEMLNVGRDDGLSGGSFDQRKNRFAESARLSEFRETPFAVKPILGEDQQHCVGAGHFAIKRALPIGAGSQARVLIEIEKRLGETVGVQPREQARGLLRIAAGMADENLRHRRVLGEDTSGRFVWQMPVSNDGDAAMRRVGRWPGEQNQRI